MSCSPLTLWINGTACLAILLLMSLLGGAYLTDCYHWKVVLSLGMWSVACLCWPAVNSSPKLLVFMLGGQSPRQSLLQVFMGGARLWGHILHVYSECSPDEGRWEGPDWWHQLVWNVMEIASPDVIYIPLLGRWVCAIIDDLLCVLPDQPHAVGKGVEMIWSESLALQTRGCVSLVVCMVDQPTCK